MRAIVTLTQHRKSAFISPWKPEHLLKSTVHAPVQRVTAITTVKHMPACNIIRPATWLFLMAGSCWLIKRWRFIGVIISVLVGWGILVFAYSMWPAPIVPNDWDEDREEMPTLGLFVMSIWCLPVLGITELWRWFRRTRTNAPF